MRSRVEVHLAETPEQAVAQFKGELDGEPRSPEGALYGLALALTAAGRPEEARVILNDVWVQSPGRLEYIIADAEIDMARNQPMAAAKKLSEQLKVSPGNHPLTMAYANALMQGQQPHIAEEVLLDQSKRKPDDPNLWYLLAEVQGLSGNIAGLHQSRAEYFILKGILDEAERQLKYALKLTRGDYPTTEKINQRLRDIRQMREQLEQF